MSLAETGRVALVGAGKMGGALLAGWLKRGLPGESVTVVDPGPPPEVEKLIAMHGIGRDDWKGRLEADLVVLAVKPQMMDEVLAALALRLPETTAILSIAAGTPIAAMAGHLGEGRPIVRAMPNTPAAIGRGITVACANARADSGARAAADGLLGAVGAVEWIEDEGLIDAVTAVSGSGPAYLFWLTQCLAEAGVEAGLPRTLAENLARATMTGSGALMEQSQDSAETLRRAVTSPGGTTEAALQVLMAGDGLAPLMKKAVAQAAERSRQLAG